MLSARDYRHVLKILDIVYSVPDRSAMFAALCREMQKVIGICGAVFVPVDPKTGDYKFKGYEIFNNVEGAMLIYIAHYQTLDPFILSGWLKNSSNRAALNTAIEPKLIETEFACDFLLPLASVFYVAASTLRAQGDLVGVLAFHRQKQEGSFSRRHMEIINVVLPHIARSLHISDLMHGRDLINGPDGVIGLGENGRPFYINNEVKQALKGAPVESIPDPGFSPETSWFKSAAGTYRIRTVPLGRRRRGKFVLLERYPPEGKLWQKIVGLNLSRREKELAVLVIQGYSNREIAERLFICEQTVKDHLHNIFEKLTLRRRSELAARVFKLHNERTEVL